MLEVTQRIRQDQISNSSLSNSNTYVLKPVLPDLRVHPSHLEDLLKYTLLGPTPEFSIQQVFGEA